MDNKKMITLKVKNFSGTQEFAEWEKFTLEEMELAYQKAAELESQGMEVMLEIPGAVDTLAKSLGKCSLKEQSELLDSINDEIHDHE